MDSLLMICPTIYQSSHSVTLIFILQQLGVYLGVRTCELFLCLIPFVFLGFIVLTSLFSLFYVTGEFNRFLHRGWATIRPKESVAIRNFSSQNINAFNNILCEFDWNSLIYADANAAYNVFLSP